MNDNLQSVLNAIEFQPQCHDEVIDQLRDLSIFANKLGLHDAADVVLKQLGIISGVKNNAKKPINNKFIMRAG